MRIAFGTDGNAGWSPHVEMADMVASGMTPHEVLVAAPPLPPPSCASKTPERSRKDRVPTVVLAANPLDDITNTRRIEAVFLRGTAVDRAALSERWGGDGTR